MADHTSDSTSFSARDVALAVIPHITGSLSVIGSLWIIVDILRPRRRAKKLKSTYHRVLLCMSVSDLMGSFSMAFSTWPIPSADSGVLDGGTIFGASGNQGTCTAQGFFIQLGMGAPLYSGFLSLYYLLLVRYNWTEVQINRLEKVFHLCVWLLTIGTALASLGLTLFNSANLFCWIAPLPMTCVSTVEVQDGNGTCVRGDNAWVYRLAFYFIWIWLSLICVMVAMAMVFWTVYSQTRSMNKYNHKRHASAAQQKKIRRVAIQAALYVGSFFLTVIFPSIQRMTQAKWNCTTEFFPLSLLVVTFLPLQGFWNFFIYMRPRYLKFRKKHKDWSMMQVARETLSKTICCGSSEDDTDFSDDDNEDARVQFYESSNTMPVSTVSSLGATKSQQISLASLQESQEDPKQTAGLNDDQDSRT